MLHDVFKRVLTKYKIYEHFVVPNTIIRLICYFILWVYVYDITAIYRTESLIVNHSQDLFCRFVRVVVLCNCNRCKKVNYAFFFQWESRSCYPGVPPLPIFSIVFLTCCTAMSYFFAFHFNIYRYKIF